MGVCCVVLSNEQILTVFVTALSLVVSSSYKKILLP